MRTPLRSLAALTVATTLSFGLVACGDDEDAGQDAAPSPAAAPVADLDGLTGVQTEVIVDAGFLAGLESLMVTPGVVGDATLQDGTLAFPITGGSATYYEPGSRDPYVESNILHEGSGISLTAGTGSDATVVELTDFVVDAGTSMLMGDVSANGEEAAADAPLFFLDGSTLEPLEVDEEAGTAVLFGTTVSLTDAAATLLNETFGTDALTEFFTVGVARITLALPGGPASGTGTGATGAPTSGSGSGSGSAATAEPSASAESTATSGTGSEPSAEPTSETSEQPSAQSTTTLG